MKMPIPSDWNESTDGRCSFSICWPNSEDWLSILNGLITEVSRGRFWDEKTGNIKSTQQVGIQIINDNLPLQECIMSCNDLSQLSASLDAIALALSQQQQCCDVNGSGGAGQTDTPPNTQGDGPAETVGPPPDGFSSWAEWFDKKCRIANLIINDMIADIARAGLYAGISTAVSTLAPILVTAFLTPVPFDDIAVIAFLFIEIFLIALSVSEITEHLNDNRTSYLCAILSGHSVNESIASFVAKVDELVPLDPDFSTETIRYLASSLLAKFATVASFNRLYQTNDINLPSANCDCGGCVIYSLNSGNPPPFGTTVVDNTGGNVLFAEVPGQGWRVRLDRTQAGNMEGNFDLAALSVPEVLEIDDGWILRCEGNVINTCAGFVQIGFVDGVSNDQFASYIPSAPGPFQLEIVLGVTEPPGTGRYIHLDFGSGPACGSNGVYDCYFTLLEVCPPGF